MAENFQQTIIGLQNAIDDLSGSIQDLGTQKLNRLLRSAEFKQANKSVRAVDTYDAAHSVFIKAERIKKAKSAMRSDPERWASPSDWIRDDDKRIKGQEQMAARHKAFSIWQGRNYGRVPTGLIDRIGQFGAEGGRVAFEQDFYDSYQAEFNPKEFQYEQDVKKWGRDKADVLKSKREDDERSENKDRYKRLQASRRREQRKQLYERAPWMKSLVASGIIDRKYIPKIAERVDRIFKSGSVLSKVIKNPAGILGGIGGAAALIAPKMISDYVDENAKLTTISHRHRSFGKQSGALDAAMARAGLQMDARQETFHRLQGQYGPAVEMVLKAVSNAAHGKEGWQRQMIAQSFGLSADDLTVADLLTQKRYRTKHDALLELSTHAADSKVEMKAGRDGALSAFAARIDDAFGGAPSKAVSIYQANEFTKKQNEARTAALSASLNDASGGGDNSTTNNGGDTSVSVQNNITVNGGGEVKDVVASATDGALEAARRQKVLDQISGMYKA